MTELKYGDSDVTKLMFGDTEVSGKPKIVKLSNKDSSSISDNLDLGITRQELLDRKFTSLIVSFIDHTTSSGYFWDFNQVFMVEEFLDTGTIDLQSSSKFAIMKLKFIEDNVYLVYTNSGSIRKCNIVVSAC
ncbi:hypothetical protein [Companilactobacillus nodensis]|uniref:Uncharacterized protein n=1 Tax=Companilactobacillus nodensis DSM 19682 = JCM 14932 = NBRC 107160 TaxID=1423775 RepID=A0A0R1KAP0_9LACO|nr:hypothetical protein [Companilactobacillus nodensis]KRK80758.1 hypothetical protein FD03_GL002189 [Companilactobacillus nodensis DSM 19682 = JCM 14932 = NBRC 107160]